MQIFSPLHTKDVECSMFTYNNRSNESETHYGLECQKRRRDVTFLYGMCSIGILNPSKNCRSIIHDEPTVIHAFWDSNPPE